MGKNHGPLGNLVDKLTPEQLKAAREYMVATRPRAGGAGKAGGVPDKETVAILQKKLEDSGIDLKTIKMIERQSQEARMKRRKTARAVRNNRMK